MVSSKTRVEIEVLRDRLVVHDPFVVENGGAIFIPMNSDLGPLVSGEERSGYHVIQLGLKAADIRPLFDRLAGQAPVKALSGMETDEVIALTGLNPDQAEAARNREFGEAFILEDPAFPEEELAIKVSSLGLRLTKGGRFFHLLGENDKGRSVSILIDLYRRIWPDLIAAACGDAQNDAPLLAAVDRAFLVARPDGSHTAVDIPGLTRIDRPGPAGFNQAVTSLLAGEASEPS
jgi:mannosyl-3-phosphoglycerate phosphatase